MRVGITGGAGFVGRHVAELLRENGCEVRTIDKVPGVDRYASIESMPEIVTAAKDLDVMLHLAAVSNTGAALRNPEMAWAVNVMGTQNVVTACQVNRIPRLILASSTLVSGSLEEMRLHLAARTEWIVDEQSPILPGPKHPYVATKLAAEDVVLSAADTSDLTVTVLRYGIQYGPGMTPGVLFHTLITRALGGKPVVIDGDGEQWRQYMHVEDLALAHLAVIENLDGCANQVFHVCPETKTTVNDAVKAVDEFVPLEWEHGPARGGDIDVKFCVAGRIKSKLGWEPGWSLRDGVEQTVEWYSEDDRWMG